MQKQNAAKQNKKNLETLREAPILSPLPLLAALHLRCRILRLHRHRSHRVTVAAIVRATGVAVTRSIAPELASGRSATPVAIAGGSTVPELLATARCRRHRRRCSKSPSLDPYARGMERRWDPCGSGRGHRICPSHVRIHTCGGRRDDLCCPRPPPLLMPSPVHDIARSRRKREAGWEGRSGEERRRGEKWRGEETRGEVERRSRRSVARALYFLQTAGRVYASGARSGLGKIGR